MRKDKPSKTARKVALNILTLGLKPEMQHVLPQGMIDATAELLVASGVVGEKIIRWAQSQRILSLYESLDWMMPGQFEAFGHRKAFCEDQVRKGIDTGATQILVLGAGYDTLGWRLAPEFPNANFFEIDHPATANLKAKGIAKMGMRDNLYLIQADLSKQKILDVLKEHESWDMNAKTVIIAEGLVMYLTDDAVEDMFCQCAASTGPGSRFAFSYIPSGSDGRPDLGKLTGFVLWIQKLIKEPLLWSTKPDALASFLEKTGWVCAPELFEYTEKRGVEFYNVAYSKSGSSVL